MEDFIPVSRHRLQLPPDEARAAALALAASSGASADAASEWWQRQADLATAARLRLDLSRLEGITVKHLPH